MVKKISWLLLAALSVLVGLYPSLYFVLEKRFGLLKSKPEALFFNPIWQGSFYIHISLGGLALLIGWLQFSPKIRRKHIRLHRQTGKVYVVSVLLSALAGFYIAFYAAAGFIAALGFMCLSMTWFYTTLMGYLSIRNGQVARHGMWMIYSYACCFAAVTLRLSMPVLMAVFGSFETAYTVVAWWCWVPNVVVAYLLTQRYRSHQ